MKTTAPTRSRTATKRAAAAPAKARANTKTKATLSAKSSAAKPAAGPSKEQAEHAREIDRRLSKAIPSPQCELKHENAWQLVVATILSAQCTDERVNAVTPKLFKRWRTPRALGDAALEAVEEVVRPTGFYRNKAKSITATSSKIADDFGGEVPRTMDEMLTLPGVARKTANVVLGTAYRVATGIVVDTHVGRVARRLGLSSSEDPVEVERDLCALFPRAKWIDTGHRLLLHGRYVCLAREPRCAECALTEICPSRTEEPAGTWQSRAAAMTDVKVL